MNKTTVVLAGVGVAAMLFAGISPAQATESDTATSSPVPEQTELETESELLKRIESLPDAEMCLLKQGYADAPIYDLNAPDVSKALSQLRFDLMAGSSEEIQGVEVFYEVEGEAPKATVLTAGKGDIELEALVRGNEAATKSLEIARELGAKIEVTVGTTPYAALCQGMLAIDDIALAPGERDSAPDILGYNIDIVRGSVVVSVNEAVDTKAVVAHAQETVAAAAREAGYPTPTLETNLTGMVGELYYDRDHDTTPFKAGAGLQSGFGYCSLGFKVHGVGGLTAGHCAMNGNFQGLNGVRFTNFVGSATVGDSSSNLLSSAAAIDLTVLKPVNIFGDFATKMFRGPQAIGSDLTNTRGTTGIATGSSVGFSGNRTGSWTAYGAGQVPGSSSRSAGCWVFQPNTTIAKWITICSLWQAGNNGNGKMTEPGDSGGPVYAWIAGSQDVKAAGSITGGVAAHGINFFTPASTAQYVYSKSVG